MKKLLFLMLMLLLIQCKEIEPKKACGIVTEMVTTPSTDAKSKPATIQVSYASCEYIVIMPQNKDSFEVQKYLIANGLVLQKVSELNPSVGLYSKGGTISSEGTPPTPPVKGPPPPPIKELFYRNTIVIDPFGQATTQFDAMSKVGAIQKM